MPVRDAAEIEGAVGDFVSKPNGGWLVLPDASSNRIVIGSSKMAERHRVPAVYAYRDIAADGGLMSYGVDVQELFRPLRPSMSIASSEARSRRDLPVQLPEKFELVLNLKTAAAMGLAIPTSLQLLADEVIE